MPEQREKCVISFTKAVLGVGLLLLPFAARAAMVSGYSDTLTRHRAGTAANHTILFVTPSGINAPGETMVLDFASTSTPTFTIGSVAFDDIDLAIDTGGGGGPGDCAGPFSDMTLAASAAAGVWGASFSGNILTLTAPTDAGAGEIPAGTCFQIEIGTHATFGTTGNDQIVNPSSAGAYELELSGTFGDFGLAFIPINDDDQVTVTATVPAPPPSGGGGGGPPPPPPSAPVISNVQAINITETTAQITWTTNIASDSKVDYGLTVSYGNTVSDPALVFSHSINLAGLTPGTTYQFRVRSTGSGTPEGVSGNFSFTTLDSTPPVISNVQAVDITGTSARITWDTNEDATSRVDYGTSPGPPYPSFATTPGLTNAHSVNLSGLTPNTLYRYRVTSADASSNSTTSVEFTFQTLDTVPPIISNIQVINITQTSARVTWTTNELSDSAVDYGTTVAYGQTVTNASLVANHQLDLAGLIPGTLYNFRVRSKDAAGNEAVSGNNTFTTLADTTPPANVSNLTATPGDQQILLSWTNPSDPDFAGVRIQRSTTSFPTSPTSGTTVFDGLASSFLNTGLTNGTLYYYTVFAYDNSANFASGAVVSGTPFDSTPPGPVTNLVVTPGNTQNQLTWTNPTDPDFLRVRIQRSTTGFPPTSGSGTNVFVGSGTNFLDTGLTNGTTYYYSVFAEDTSGNFAAPAQGTGTPAAPPPSCGDGICQPSETPTSCPADCPAPAPVCGDGVCESPEDDLSCPADCPAPPPPAPVCGDGICQSPETPASCPADCAAPPPPAAICGNGICEGTEDHLSCPADCPAPPPVQPPITEPPSTSAEEIALDRVRFLVMNRTIQLSPDAQGRYLVLPSRTLTVLVPGEALPKPVRSLALNFGGGSYLFQEARGQAISDSPVSGMGLFRRLGGFLIPAARAQSGGPDYVADVAIGPTPGIVAGTIIAEFEDGTADTASFIVLVVSHGSVFELVEGVSQAVGNASVLLQHQVGGNWTDWNASAFFQVNPQTTASGGAYGFMVPAGTYRLVVSADGYRTHTSAPFAVATNVVNRGIEMVRIPRPITEVIVPGAPIVENIFNVTRNLGEQYDYLAKVVRTEIIEDPRVERAATNIIVPAAAVVTTAIVATSVQAVSFLSYLYYLVTQPILLIARRRRKEYGVVFNALTSMPVDLAIVRLYRTNGKLVAARVTDKQGRYSFMAEPGEYAITASKPGFIFPTEYLKGQKEGVKYLDLYHGEVIRVTEKSSVLTPNIPMDPIEVVHSTKKLILGLFLRRAQDYFGVLSVVLTLLATLVYRQPFLFIILVIQLALYFLFRRLSRPPKPKNWGIVYDEKTKESIPFAVARIVETQYNKVLESQVTDRKGRYNFLVGNNKYYVTIEKPGYETKKTGEIDLTAQKEGEAIVAVDVPLPRKEKQ